MPFAPAPRVKYKNSPLVQVVCQVRFPALLEIDVEPPLDFHRAIRLVFPEMTQSNEVKIEIPGRAIPENLPDPVVRALDSGANRN